MTKKLLGKKIPKFTAAITGDKTISSKDFLIDIGTLNQLNIAQLKWKEIINK